MSTPTGSLLLRAIEEDFNARNGRGSAPGSLSPPAEAAWRVVVEERLRYTDEKQEEAMKAAKRAAGKG